MDKLTPLDNYKFQIKVKELGKFAWNILVYYSKIVLFLFVLITCILFWSYMGSQLYSIGINLLGGISTMLKIVIVASGLIVISEIVKGIKALRREKDEGTE